MGDHSVWMTNRTTLAIVCSVCWFREGFCELHTSVLFDVCTWKRPGSPGHPERATTNMYLQSKQSFCYKHVITANMCLQSKHVLTMPPGRPSSPPSGIALPTIQCVCFHSLLSEVSAIVQCLEPAVTKDNPDVPGTLTTTKGIILHYLKLRAYLPL